MGKVSGQPCGRSSFKCLNSRSGPILSAHGRVSDSHGAGSPFILMGLGRERLPPCRYPRGFSGVLRRSRSFCGLLQVSSQMLRVSPTELSSRSFEKEQSFSMGARFGLESLVPRGYVFCH